MKTRGSTPEQISALVDGELNYLSVETALTSLKQGGAEDTWNVYHHIGDVLRSEKDGDASSDAFMKRFSQRLAAEEPHGRPANVIINIPKNDKDAPVSRFSFTRRFALPGAAAIAAAFIAFMSAPALTTVDASDGPTLPASPSGTGILAADTASKKLPAKLADSEKATSLPAADTQLHGSQLHGTLPSD